MKRIYSIISSLAIVGCVVLNNYSTYTLVTAPWRAAGHRPPPSLGMNATLFLPILGGLITGFVIALIIGGISRLISRFTTEKKVWSRRLYFAFSILFTGYTLSIDNNWSVVISSDDERLENLRNSGMIEKLDEQGLYNRYWVSKCWFGTILTKLVVCCNGWCRYRINGLPARRREAYKAQLLPPY